MRDRLIELLNHKYDHFCDQCGVNKDSHYTESLADYLLENGVIVLPFDIGDTVYDISEFVEKRRCPEMYELNDGYISIRKDRNGEYFYEYDYVDIFPKEIGKIVFLTKEEAEQSLRKDEGK